MHEGIQIQVSLKSFWYVKYEGQDMKSKGMTKLKGWDLY